VRWSALGSQTKLSPDAASSGRGPLGPGPLVPPAPRGPAIASRRQSGVSGFCPAGGVLFFDLDRRDLFPEDGPASDPRDPRMIFRIHPRDAAVTRPRRVKHARDDHAQGSGTMLD